MTAKPRLISADALLELPRGQLRRELVRGELKELAPAGRRRERLHG